MAGIEGGSSSSSCGTARQSLVRFQKRKHVITLCSFSYFQTPADTSNIHRKKAYCRLAPEYMGSNTHARQRTQLTIVTKIIEREIVATSILSYTYTYRSEQIQTASKEDLTRPFLHKVRVIYKYSFLVTNSIQIYSTLVVFRIRRLRVLIAIIGDGCGFHYN